MHPSGRGSLKTIWGIRTGDSILVRVAPQSQELTFALNPTAGTITLLWSVYNVECKAWDFRLGAKRSCNSDFLAAPIFRCSRPGPTQTHDSLRKYNKQQSCPSSYWDRLDFVFTVKSRSPIVQGFWFPEAFVFHKSNTTYPQPYLGSYTSRPKDKCQRLHYLMYTTWVWLRQRKQALQNKITRGLKLTACGLRKPSMKKP